MAPEAIAGGVAPASDWWSMGMILLERVTSGACFEGINEQAFLIHVLTNGVPLPENLNANIELLFRGLLARDRRQGGGSGRKSRLGLPVNQSRHLKLPLAPRMSMAARQFLWEASNTARRDPLRWRRPKRQLGRRKRPPTAWRGGDMGVGGRFRAKNSLRASSVRQSRGLTDDLRLSIALKTLNPSMPLIVRGNIVTPGWLLDHPDDGYNLITGPAPDLIRKVDPEDWLWRLKLRAETVRKRLQQLEIAIDEETLRVHLLSTSMARLAALWEEKRKLLPDTDHAGVISLIERRQSAEEDLVILLSASPGQFRSVAEVVDEAAKEASTAGLTGFSRDPAAALLARPRREIYRMIDDRIENFARCDVSSVDEWANQFRLDRRMPIARALALLSVAPETWRPLPKQGYVSTILDFFAKRISGGVLRGPLTRMLIGKTARVDLTELDTSRVPAAEILEHLLSRGTQTVNVDPAAFSENDGLERRLRSLHSHALLYRRDTGIDGLYMAFPFLLMRDGRPNAKPRIRAPAPVAGAGHSGSRQSRTRPRWDMDAREAPTPKPNTSSSILPLKEWSAFRRPRGGRKPPKNSLHVRASRRWT